MKVDDFLIRTDVWLCTAIYNNKSFKMGPTDMKIGHGWLNLSMCDFVVQGFLVYWQQKKGK